MVLAFCPGTRKEHFLELAKMAQQASVCCKPDSLKPEATWRRREETASPMSSDPHVWFTQAHIPVPQETDVIKFSLLGTFESY